MPTKYRRLTYRSLALVCGLSACTDPGPAAPMIAGDDDSGVPYERPDADADPDPDPQDDGGGPDVDSGDDLDIGELFPDEVDECAEARLVWQSAQVEPSLDPDWSEGLRIPVTGRPNPYGLTGVELIETVRKGKKHALVYPVQVTQSLIPLTLLERLVTQPPDPSVIDLLFGAVNPLSQLGSIDEFEEWLGLPAYPGCDGGGVRSIPYPEGVLPEYRMGSTRLDTANGVGLTFSCAACHSSELFGRSILGLQARASRANHVIEVGREILDTFGTDFLATAVGMTEEEKRMLAQMQAALHNVGGRMPLARGLDTSLAQVGLSLAKRVDDDYATIDPAIAAAPRDDRLVQEPADSKPGNWWVLKYKTRWLLDGSVVSGNPIYTNLLWNEIGRGIDVRELERWIDANMDVVNDLTAAVFATEAPRYTEFFPAESIDIEAAKRGKLSFDANCARCHGIYKKAWELEGAASLTPAQRLATIEVRYHESTPVEDVGTDAYRYLGMTSLEPLNDLALSKKIGVLIRPQQGYVPPPLVGIWARYPYFHNNSAPSLCAVLTRAEDRPATYHSGAQIDPETDFDAACNGYPLGDAVPQAWIDDGESLFDTSIPGMGNQGHDEGVFLRDGEEIFTPEQKAELIQFLKTL